MPMRRFSRLLGWAAALLVGATLPRPVAAQAPYQIAYRGPEGCPTEEAFRSDVSAQVKDPSTGDGAQLQIVITQGGGGYQGELVVTDRAGVTDRMHLELDRPEPSCAAVAHALAFKASIAIRYGGHFEPPPEPAPPPLPPPTSSPAARPPAPLEAAPQVAFALHAAGGILGGLGPRVRPMVELGASVGDARARLLSPWMSLSVDAARGLLPSPLGNIELWLVRSRILASLLRLGGDAFFVRPCVGLALGAVMAQAPPGAEYLKSPTNPWVSTELALHAHWNVTPGFFVQAEGGPALLVVAERYLLDGTPSTTLYTSPHVSAQGSLGLGLML